MHTGRTCESDADTVWDDRVVDDIAWVFVLRTNFIQARDLEFSASVIVSTYSSLSIPDNSFHDTNEHQRCRNQYQRRQRRDYCYSVREIDQLINQFVSSQHLPLRFLILFVFRYPR